VFFGKGKRRSEKYNAVVDRRFCLQLQKIVYSKSNLEIILNVKSKNYLKNEFS
jgi:hypothetical protein